MIQNYTITTWDDKIYPINAVNGARLMEAWTTADKPFPVDLGDVAISSSAIKSITPNILTEADLPVFDEKIKRLEAGNRCRGQYSIQLEINKIADSTGILWKRNIQDGRWRENTRQKLLEVTKDWCDYKSGTCICEADFLSYKARHERKMA